MSRSFVPQTSFPGAPNAGPSNSEPFAPVSESEFASVETPEFEFVLGHRQVASVGLVALTALVAFACVAYLIGKSAAPASAQVPVAAQQAPAASLPPVAAKPVEPLPEAPVFDIPVKRLSYVQLGSVERGSAILMVQGARKLGYPSFVAAGTNPNVFRVLVGPFPKPAEYQTAQTLFKSMGLDTFERIYADAAEAARPSKP